MTSTKPTLYRHVSAVLLMIGLIGLICMLPSTTHAHLAMIYPPCRGSPVDRSHYDGKVHCFIGFEKDRTFPCNGYNEVGPVTALQAGQQVDVRFWGPAMKNRNYYNLPTRPDGSNETKVLNQARHGGGTCQFSLSYDGGKTFHLIGKYSRSCPDIYYSWPVKIPDNVPSCTQRGQCLLVWSWTAHFVDQYYQNCADVTIEGKVVPGQLPTKGIQVDNVVEKGYMKGFTAPGDDAGNDMGKGPNIKDFLANMKDLWS